MLYVIRYFFEGRPISRKEYESKCASSPKLPVFKDDKPVNTLGRFVRELRREQRKKAILELSKPDIEEQRIFDEECRFETRTSGSMEIVRWLLKGAKRKKELGELTSGKALHLARKLYSLGAAKAWVTHLERDPDGAGFSRILIILLPLDNLQISKIFNLFMNPSERVFGGITPDIRTGKKYMRVTFI